MTEPRGWLHLVAEHPVHEKARCCWCQGRFIQVDGVWWCETEACRVRQRSWAIALQVPKFEVVDGRHQFAGYRSQYWWVPLPKQVNFLELRAPQIGRAHV